MSDEVKETREEKGTSMYVHQIDYATFLQVVGNVTNVNKMFVYSMPNKASSYADDGFNLINTLNGYIGGEEDWRISISKNVNFTINEGKVYAGDYELSGSLLCMSIPKINSFIIIPDSNGLYKGSADPTKIIQLTNCICVTPLLMRLTDEPIEGEEEKFNLGVSYEVIVPKTEETEKPTE
jgi:hypothetical protein